MQQSIPAAAIIRIIIRLLAVAFAFFALGAVAHGNAHRLRCQNLTTRLIIPGLLLAAVAIFALVFAPTLTVVSLIVTFLLFILLTYTLFGLFCFLTCDDKRRSEGNC